MALPSALLLISHATENYWMELLTWLLVLGVAGYAAWPLSRTALAAVSPGPGGRWEQDDWWVRDGFVRATSAFLFTICGGGRCFLVVPGVMVLMIYSLYPFVIVEKEGQGISSRWP